MHGPQSYEGSGGESSGDEEDLDRFFFKSRYFQKSGIIFGLTYIIPGRCKEVFVDWGGTRGTPLDWAPSQPERTTRGPTPILRI